MRWPSASLLNHLKAFTPPLGIDFQDCPALQGEPPPERRPKVQPLIELIVEDRATRRVVHGQTSRERSAEHRDGGVYPAGSDPEVSRRLPTIAAFQLAPGPR